MRCPRCNYLQSDTNLECRSCGVIFAQYKEMQEVPKSQPLLFAVLRAGMLPAVFIAALFVTVGTGLPNPLSFGERRVRLPGSGIMSAQCEAAAAEQGASDTQITALCYGRREPPRPARPVRKPAGVKLADEAWAAYENAKRAVRQGDMEGAVGYFEEAVDVEPEFTEAWYNKGAALAHMAIAAAGGGNEQEGVELFREAVAAKKKTQELIDRERWFVYNTPAERDQVRHDLHLGLAEADEVLADEESLRAALKLWAAVGE